MLKLLSTLIFFWQLEETSPYLASEYSHVGGKEPVVPERALDLEPEDLGLGWWLVGSWLNDPRLLLRLGTQIL